MLSETTLGFLSTLIYRADAKRQVCWLPLGGIYWKDEMADIRHLMKIPEDDKNQIFRCSVSDCDSGKASLYLTLSGCSGTRRIRRCLAGRFFGVSRFQTRTSTPKRKPSGARQTCLGRCLPTRIESASAKKMGFRVFLQLSI